MSKPAKFKMPLDVETQHVRNALVDLSRALRESSQERNPQILGYLLTRALDFALEEKALTRQEIREIAQAFHWSECAKGWRWEE